MAEEQTPQPFPRREGALILAVACLIWGLTLAKCIFCVDDTWDSWWYHLPFAARLSGVVATETYGMSEWLESCYRGFPVLGESLQGLLWRLTGRIESANLVAGLSLLSFALGWSRILRMPFALLTIMLFSVPLIQFHATRCHVDLLAALLVASFLAGLVRLSLRGPLKAPEMALLLGCGAAACNTKFFSLPPVFVGHVYLLYLLISRHSSAIIGFNKSAFFALWALCIGLCGATLVSNTIRLGNPVYPVRISVFGRELPGTRKLSPELPPYMTKLPRSLQWALSITEVDWIVRHKVHLGLAPYSVDMAATDEFEGSRRINSRTGGFFGPLVIAQLALFFYLNRVLLGGNPVEARKHRTNLVFLTILTLLASTGPQSIELRYSFYWILMLLLVNLILIEAAERRTLLPWLARGHLAILAFTLLWTHLGAFRPFSWSKSPFAGLETYKQHYVDPQTESKIEETAAPVVLLHYSPRAFLYCDYFWPERPEHPVKALDDEEDLAKTQLDNSLVLKR